MPARTYSGFFQLPGQAVFDRATQHVTAITRTPDTIDLFVIGNNDHVWSDFSGPYGWN